MIVAFYLVLVGAWLTGCGSDSNQSMAPAAASSAPTSAPTATPVPVPTYSETLSFASNTACQLVYSDKSAQKPAAHSSSLKIFNSVDCSGSPLATLSEATVSTYVGSDGEQYTLSGTNSTGLTLNVVKF